MIVINNSIEIIAPAEKVYGILVNPEMLPLWNYYITNVKKISSDTATVGSRYHQKGKNDEQILEVKSVVPNKAVELATVGGSSMQFNRKMNISSINSHCVLKDFFELDTGHPVFLQKLLAVRIQHAVRENLSKLKQLLETGKTVLQDGRTSVILNTQILKYVCN